MSDAMMFPETIEEFIDQYKFIDTDQIYTNGSELIQVFRVMHRAFSKCTSYGPR